MAAVAHDDGSEPAAGDGTVQAPSFTSQVEKLFNEVHPPGRGPYTMDEVADGVAAVGGPRHSSSYYSLLRSGTRDNPTINVVVALARFFAVPLSYFAPHTEQGVQPDALREGAARTRALRELVTKLERIERPDQIAAITAVVDSFQAPGSDEA